MVEYIGPLAALLGVVLGGSLTYLANAKLKNSELNRAEIRDELKSKRELYSKFLAEANILSLSAIEEKKSSPTIFNELSKITVEIELVASDAVLAKAREIMAYVVDCHQLEPENNDLSTTLASLRSEFISFAKEEFLQIKRLRT